MGIMDKAKGEKMAKELSELYTSVHYFAGPDEDNPVGLELSGIGDIRFTLILGRKTVVNMLREGRIVLTMQLDKIARLLDA